MTSDELQTWDRSLSNFADFVARLESWDAPSPCPGWTVGDLVSHTIDLESMLAADTRPEHTPNWSNLTHIDSDFGRLTEVGVDFRRGRSREEQLTELSEAHARARLRIEALGPDAVIPWLRGDTPIPILLGMRTFDIWLHEQDAREAVNKPGNLDGPGSQNALRYLTAGLPKVWGKAVGAPVGSVLELHIEAPGVSGEYWIGVGADGKATFVEATEAACSVTLPWASFVMLAGGRDPHEKFAASAVVVGDQELGQSLVNLMAVTP